MWIYSVPFCECQHSNPALEYNLQDFAVVVDVLDVGWLALLFEDGGEYGIDAMK